LPGSANSELVPNSKTCSSAPGKPAGRSTRMRPRGPEAIGNADHALHLTMVALLASRWSTAGQVTPGP
jgi:hypothetical protein